MDDLVSLLKAYGPAAPNEDVKRKILELVQAWAGAAEGRHDLFYIGETYRTLQREGFHFPPKVEISSSMLDSNAPPEWIDSDVCMRCRKPFTFTNRKHHCRNCGNVFDGQCSTKTIPLPHLGIMTPVRVDDGCHARLTEKARNISLPLERSLSRGNASIIRDRGFMQPRDARVDHGFDDDLQKALKMSLDDVKGQAGTGFVPQSQLQAQRPSPTVNGHVQSQKSQEEEEDPELQAAIAASIKEMEEQKKQHAASLKNQSSSNAPAPSAEVTAVRNQYELSAVEEENINLFSTLVDRLQQQPSGTVLREPQIQELYDSIGTLRPKLARSYGETMSKHDTLLDLHSKLAAVVRYYDRMLEDRLSNAYGQQALGGYRAPTQPSSSNLYPNLQSDQQPVGSNAESFYGVNTSSSHQNSFQSPQVASDYPQQRQMFPQQQESTIRRGSYSQAPTPYSPLQSFPQAPSWRTPGDYHRPGDDEMLSSPQYAPQFSPNTHQGLPPERRPTLQSQDPIPEYPQHQASPQQQPTPQNFYNKDYAPSPERDFRQPSQQHHQPQDFYPQSTPQHAPPPSQSQANAHREPGAHPDLTLPPQQAQYQPTPNQQQQQPQYLQQTSQQDPSQWRHNPPSQQQQPESNTWPGQSSFPQAPSHSVQGNESLPSPHQEVYSQSNFGTVPRHEPAIQPKVEEALIEL